MHGSSTYYLSTEPQALPIGWAMGCLWRWNFMTVTIHGSILGQNLGLELHCQRKIRNWFVSQWGFKTRRFSQFLFFCPSHQVYPTKDGPWAALWLSLRYGLAPSVPWCQFVFKSHHHLHIAMVSSWFSNRYLSCQATLGPLRQEKKTQLYHTLI